jgi:hypothetical protein
MTDSGATAGFDYATPEPRERLREHDLYATLMAIRVVAAPPRSDAREAFVLATEAVNHWWPTGLPATPASPPPPSTLTPETVERFAKALCDTQEWCDGTCPQVEGEAAIHGHHAKVLWAAGFDLPGRPDSAEQSAPYAYSGPHDDCIATVPHYHDRQYRIGDWGDSTEPSAPADSALRAALLTDENLEVIVHILGCPRWEENSTADCTYRRIHTEDAQKRGPALRAALDSKPSADSERLREAAEEMFRLEAMICVGCGLVMDREPDMLAAHEADRANSSDCPTLPLRRALEATPPDSGSRLPPDPAPLDVAWAEAEAALPPRGGPTGRYIVLTGPIAGGVYWAYATLFNGNEALHEQRENREPAGFGGSPPNGSAAAALQALTAKLRALPPSLVSAPADSGEAPSPAAEPRE